MNAHLDDIDPRVRILVEKLAARLDMGRALKGIESRDTLESDRALRLSFEDRRARTIRILRRMAA
jgi:hypothetical protein